MVTRAPKPGHLACSSWASGAVLAAVLAACAPAEVTTSSADAGAAVALPDASAPPTADASASTTDAAVADPDAGIQDATSSDAAPADTDAGAEDATVSPEDPVDPTRPLRVLFIGNSFTFGGPVPTIVDVLANDAGWPDPLIEYIAFGGETLEGHRGRPETVALVDRGGWDVVVLQEFSTRPTDAIGDPQQFKEDATWFHDRVRATSPQARVLLYETWARHPDHPYYPGTFRDPADMQAQLRAHYEDATFQWIPAHATVPALPAPELGRAGDAWQRHLARPDALRLHASDDYHAAETGQYLNALVMYATIYHRAVRGLTPWRLSLADAQTLQEDADAITGWTMPGGPPNPMVPVGLRSGQRIQLDFGDTPTDAAGWTSLADPTGGSAINVLTADGAASTVDAYVTVNFGGVNGVGLANNALGFPAEASRDSFFAGSFTDHAQGLDHPAQLTLRGLDPMARYTVNLFGSRAGDDGGIGRLTRYEVTGAAHLGWQDVEISDNTARVATFTDVAPSAAGELLVDVAVSPLGTGRFAYLGVLTLVRP